MSYEEILIGWRKCEVCNKDIIVTNRRIGIKYCSKRCRNIGNWRVSVLHFPEHSTQYYQKNKERILKRMKKYSKNPKVKEHKKKYDEQYYQRPEVIARKEEYSVEYRERNKERLDKKAKEYYHKKKRFDKKAMKRQVIIQRKRRRTESGKSKMKAENHKRRFSKHIWVIRKKGYVTLDILKKQIVEKFKDVAECYYCGSKKNLSLDHIAPLSKYDINEIWNFVVACKKCNSSKSNKNPFVWAKEKNITLPTDFKTNFSERELRQKYRVGLRVK